MYCKTCGNLLDDNDAVCGVCGAVATRREEASANEEAPPTRASEYIPPPRKFDFAWDTQVFRTDERRKSEDIDFNWSLDDASSHRASIGEAAREKATEEAVDKRMREGSEIFMDDIFHLRANPDEEARFMFSKKNEEFQELLDEEFEKIRDRQTQIDEERNRVNDEVMNAEVATPEVLVTGENALQTAEERIAEFLKKADREMLETINRRVQDRIDKIEQDGDSDEIERDRGVDKIERDGDADKIERDGEADKIEQDGNTGKIERDGGADKIERDGDADKIERDGGADKIERDGAADQPVESMWTEPDRTREAAQADEDESFEPMRGRAPAAKLIWEDPDRIGASFAADDLGARNQPFEDEDRTQNEPDGEPFTEKDIISDTSEGGSGTKKVPVVPPKFDAPPESPQTEDSPFRPDAKVGVAGLGLFAGNVASPIDERVAATDTAIGAESNPATGAEPDTITNADPDGITDAEPDAATDAKTGSGPDEKRFYFEQDPAPFANGSRDAAPWNEDRLPPYVPQNDKTLKVPDFVNRPVVFPFDEEDSVTKPEIADAETAVADVAPPTAEGPAVEDAAPPITVEEAVDAIDDSIVEEASDNAVPIVTPIADEFATDAESAASITEDFATDAESATSITEDLATDPEFAMPIAEDPATDAESAISISDEPAGDAETATPIAEDTVADTETAISGAIPADEESEAPGDAIAAPIDGSIPNAPESAPIVAMEETERPTPDADGAEASEARSQESETNASESVRAGSEENDEKKKPRKKSRIVMTIVVDIIVILAVLCVSAFAILKFAPDSGVGEWIGRGVYRIADRFDISKDAESGRIGIGAETEPDTEADTSDSDVMAPLADKDTLVASQLYNNINIENVVYDPNAAYRTGVAYPIDGAASSTVIENNYWTVDELGRILYDESAVATVIRYNSGLISYINNGNSGVLGEIETGSAAETKLADEAASAEHLRINMLGIGDIRQNGREFFVWTIETVTETKDGVESANVYKKLYLLTPDISVMKVRDCVTLD